MLPDVAVLVNGSKDDQLTNALQIEVIQRMGERTEYSIQYTFDEAEGDFPLTFDERVGPGSELAIVTPFGGTNEYLVKGPVAGHRLEFKRAGEGSILTVLGSDTAVAMDRESKAALWDGLHSDAASAILGQYGYTPDVETTKAGQFEAKHALVQRDTDYRFLQMLAARNGFLLWITCDDAGVETAHFRRPSLDGEPAKELILNSTEGKNNIDAIEIEWNTERYTSATAKQLDVSDHSTIDGDVMASPLTPLGADPLSSIAAGARTQHLYAPVDDAANLQARAESALIDEGWFIRARCETTAKLLGGVVKPTDLVKLRGLGSRHSGLYMVAATHHVINVDAHTLKIELCRNAWGN